MQKPASYIQGDNMNIKLPNRDSPLEAFMPFKDVKIMITDLDGTIVSDKKIYGQFRGLQNQYSALTVTIATGRTYAGVKEITKDIKIRKGTPILLYNGAVILRYENETIIQRKTIPNHVLEKLRHYIESSNNNYLLAYFLYLGQSGIEEKVAGFGKTPLQDFNGSPVLRIEDISSARSNSLFDENDFFSPCSILIMIQNSDQNSAALQQYLSTCGEVDCTSSGNNYLEIVAKGVNKGAIVDIMKRERNGKCVAIGDNDNDVELLKNADIGVAVANASESAKGAADYLCNDEGVSGALELLWTIKVAARYD